jgi:hypothetical protein
VRPQVPAGILPSPPRKQRVCSSLVRRGVRVFFVNQPGSDRAVLLPLRTIRCDSRRGNRRACYCWRVNALCTRWRNARLHAKLVAAVLTVESPSAPPATGSRNTCGLDGAGLPEVEKVAFVTGRRTFEQALTYVHKRPTENGWPRRDLSQECFPSNAFSIVPTRKAPWTGRPKVWTLSFLQESRLPHPAGDPESRWSSSVGFGPHWHRIVFGTPEEERRQSWPKIDVNYFLRESGGTSISRSPRRFQPRFFGCLAYSPLFQPDSLKSRFRIASAPKATRCCSHLAGSSGNWQDRDKPTNSWSNGRIRRRARSLRDWVTWADICGRLPITNRTQGRNAGPLAWTARCPRSTGWQ